MKYIPLTRGQVAIVDDEDFARANAHKWYAHRDRNTWYAKRGIRNTKTQKQTTQSLHRFISGRPRQDHINRNGLDCRRENLRTASRAQNARNSGPRKNNTIGFKGVSAVRYPWGTVTYRGIVWVSGRAITTKNYKLAEDAARAYDVLAKRHYGEFAYLNFATIE